MQAGTLMQTTPDGVDLFVYCWTPDAAEAKAVVHVAHGLAEHAARYERLADALTAAGYVVYANDHRGHGKTAGTEGDLGFFAEADGFQKCIGDLVDMVAEWKRVHPGLPVVLFGHSMGAFFTQAYICEYGGTLAGAVLSGPPAGAAEGIDQLREAACAERERIGPRGRSELLTQLTFGQNNAPFEPARTAFDWLSRDAEEVDTYVGDPLCGFDATTQLWIDLADGVMALADPAKFVGIPKDLPLLIFAGNRDPVGGMGDGVRGLADAYTAGGLRNVACKLYPGGRHEMLNETNRGEVTAELVVWLDEAVGAAAGK